MAPANPFLPALVGTTIEFFETTVIAYAIFHAGYRKEAVLATALGHVLVLGVAFLIWPVHKWFPIGFLRILAGVLLTLMGLTWSIKSARRLMLKQRPEWAANPLQKVGVEERALTYGFSIIVFLIMLKSALVEAFEILFVVLPLAASSRQWLTVLIASFLGITLVMAVTMLMHRGLKKIPEVKLKLWAGLVLTTIGVIWLSGV